MRNSTRRDFLRGTIGAGLASALPLTALAQKTSPASGDTAATPPSAGGFRFVHLTDIHIEPELEAAKGFAKCLEIAQSKTPGADFILTGGDLVFDVLEASPQRARELFTLFKKVLADHTSLPVHHTIGNHDVFGWARKNGVTPEAVEYGKAMVKDMLGLKETYYEFDHKGWRFLVLDNIQPGEGGNQVYRGALDRPQFEWLAERLKRANPETPIAICEHIPIMTVTPFAFPGTYRDGKWEMSNSLVCGDTAERLKLYRDRNVRLCLSGHIHQLDRIEYRGMTLICDGAVCGNWWKGPREGVKEGFGQIELWPDGKVDHVYCDYGWRAAAG